MAALDDAKAFALDVLQGVREGNVSSIVIVSLVAFLVLRLVLPRAAFMVIMRVLILATLGAASWFGYQHAQDRFEDPIYAYAVLGAGALMVLMSIVVMAMTTRDNVKARARSPVAGAGPAHRTGGRAIADPWQGRRGPVQHDPAAPAAASTSAHQGFLSTFNGLDPSTRANMFSTIAFMFIAEFGVFSSVTITAKSPTVGAAFFLVFHLAAIGYVWTSWQDPKTGLKHYAVVAVSSVLVALLLYYTWSTEAVALTALFPVNFFVEPTMVASVTGVAFSLIIGGKG